MTIKMTGTTFVRADREAVWRAFHDVRDLKLCIAGCTDLRQTSRTLYALSVSVGIGPVRASVSGTVEITESQAPGLMTLAGRGAHPVLGDASGKVRVALTEVPGGCRLAYALDAEPRGPFAIIGSTLAAAIARTLVETFLAAFKVRLETGRPIRGTHRPRPQQPTATP